MAYRITYGRKRWKFRAMPVLLGLIAAAIVCIGAEEGLYDALARYVGGMILGPG